MEACLFLEKRDCATFSEQMDVMAIPARFLSPKQIPNYSTSRRGHSKYVHRRVAVPFLVYILVAVLIVKAPAASAIDGDGSSMRGRRDGTTSEPRIFYSSVPENYDQDEPTLSRLRALSAMFPSGSKYRVFTPSDQQSFLRVYGDECYGDGTSTGAVLERYGGLASHHSLKVELWKYCLLYVHGGTYIDPNGVVLLRMLDDFELASNSSVVASTEDLSAALSAFIMLSQSQSSVPKEMVRFLVESSNDMLSSSPTMLPRKFAQFIEADNQRYKTQQSADQIQMDPKSSVPSSSPSNWVVLRTKCIKLGDLSASAHNVWDGIYLPPPSLSATDPEQRILQGTSDSSSSLPGTMEIQPANEWRASSHCPRGDGGHCCRVYLQRQPTLATIDMDDDPLLLIRHPITAGSVGYEKAVMDKKGIRREIPSPYLMHADKVPSDMSYSVPPEQIPFFSTIRERSVSSNTASSTEVTATAQPSDGEQSPTPSMFDLMFENDCLPTSKECHRCLKRAKDGVGGDCEKCAEPCGCYCRALCKIRPPEKRVVKELRVYPPVRRKDVERLVPRIVHQTWFEPVTKEKYPNMSRLIESWKRSGWEYNFYDDDTAADFLSMHFPSEVREAYDAILPGAFKADLFRYCVLLIRGGVYADMDVLLESNLDDVVANDVGFMTPIDEPGIKVGRRSCLWNGLIAVAPGHPFLAKTIELVVNNIRNRFTSVDYDDMLCPDPVIHVSHTVDTLFTCGPCIFGAGINAVLGRHMQNQFEIGDVNIWKSDWAAIRSEPHNNQTSVTASRDDPRLLIPGRTIILQQNKLDMGAHRFTWVERNIMVAATDMPDYDDRPPTMEHYSKTHGKAGVYGFKKLYKDNVSADEKIRIVVKNVT